MEQWSQGLPILFIIRFPPHAVAVIVVVCGTGEAVDGKKTQKNYKAGQCLKVMRSSDLGQVNLNPECLLA